jgi:hypothetical protein
MVLIVAGVCILVAQVGSNGCARCRAIAIGAGVALLVGVVLVRSAWRAMRRGPGAQAP